MTKALLIGCGNIGAGYDLDGAAKVWTHAKAYSLNKEIALTVFDQDVRKAQQIAATYKASILYELSDEVYREFDIISITTPTTTHFHYLKKIFAATVPVVICEKPIVSDAIQSSEVEELYNLSKSKVLVNYIRRFQPGYAEAKKRLIDLRNSQSLRQIIVKYKRGFLNNASHAADLLEYLFEKKMEFDNFHCTSATFDAFDYDPTLTATCLYDNCPVLFAGITDCSYPVFELELFFSSSKVVICHGGNEIRYYNEHNGNCAEKTEERQTHLLDTYMLPVIDEAINLYNAGGRDNFIPSLELNNTILDIIEPLKNRSNATISH